MQITEIYKINNKLNSISLLQRNLFIVVSLISVLISISTTYNSIVMVLYSLLICFTNPLSFSRLLKFLTIPFLFIITSCITLLISINSGIVLFRWMNLDFGYDPNFVDTALYIGSKGMALCTLFYLYISTTSISEIALSMRRIKVPALFIELFILTYKYIFNTIQSSQQIVIAQKSRLAYNNKRKNYTNLSYWAGGVFNHSLLQAEGCYHGMLSRSYQSQFITLQPEKNKKSSPLLNGALFIQIILFVSFYQACQ